MHNAKGLLCGCSKSHVLHSSHTFHNGLRQASSLESGTASRTWAAGSDELTLDNRYVSAGLNDKIITPQSFSYSPAGVLLALTVKVNVRVCIARTRQISAANRALLGACGAGTRTAGNIVDDFTHFFCISCSCLLLENSPGGSG